MQLTVGSRARLKADPEQEWFFVVKVDRLNETARLLPKKSYLAGSLDGCSGPLPWKYLDVQP